MTNTTAQQFTIGRNTYRVTEVRPIDSTLTRTIKALADSGKDCCHYAAAKVLKSGKLSTKQTGVFLRFTESNRFISAY